MGTLTRQAGSDSFSASVDPRLGIIAVTVKYHASDLVTALTVRAPDIGINIPESRPRVISARPGGDVEGFNVIFTYEGIENPDDAGGESFDLDGSTNEDPIETHWNYQVLRKNYKALTATGPEFRGKWPMMLKDTSGKESPNPMHGVESWLSPGLIWNHNYVTPTFPTNLVSTLGSITRKPPGNPPTLTGNRDWLVMRIRARDRGNVWQIQVSYELSGPNGSVPEIYASRGGGSGRKTGLKTTGLRSSSL